MIEKRNYKVNRETDILIVIVMAYKPLTYTI